MKKIFTFEQFSLPKGTTRKAGHSMNEELASYAEDNTGTEDPSKMLLKRQEFDVVLPPGKVSEEPGGGPGGGGGKIVTGVVEAPGEKPLPKVQPKPKPVPQPVPQPNPGDKPGDKTPPPALPQVGDKVRLSDGRETTIKRVLPNGDIEV